MTTIAKARPSPFTVTTPPAPVLTEARLVGLGTALPPHRLDRAASRARLADLWGLTGARRAWWDRLVEGSGIDSRHAARPIEDVIDLSTAQRMLVFAQEAPRLAERAAVAALDTAGVSAGEITDLIVVTCTGFAAPGIDVDLVNALGLRPSVRRLQVGFMGCFGAITGLRAAAGACSADPHGVALVVCVELCTLHLRNDTTRENLVATALFGDGAAAAVVAGRDAPTRTTGFAAGRSCRIGLGTPGLLPHRRDAMTWTITDAGFAMTLSRDVPVAIRDEIAQMASAAGIDPAHSLFAIHPGGTAILDAVDAGLGLGGERGLRHSWSTLADPGNVSSGTALFVLSRLLAEEAQRADAAAPPIELLAFGPGLTVEHLRIV